MATEIYVLAEEYLEKGYSIIPIQEGGKRPLIEWKPYQEKRITKDEAVYWWEERASNLAIVTGPLSHVVVIDFDYQHGGKDYESKFNYKDYCVRTGRGGLHAYYFSLQRYIGNFTSILPGVDVRGEGGYVVAPPSKTAARYVWERGSIPLPSSLPPIELSGLLPIIEQSKKEINDIKYPSFTQGAGSLAMPLQFVCAEEGSRNHAAARAAGQIVRRTRDFERCRQLLQYYNVLYLRPPLPSDELDCVLQSIYSRHYRTIK